MEHDLTLDVVREAESTIIHARWHIYEEQALARVEQVAGLACTPMFPGSPAIHVVACDGLLIGEVRKHRAGTNLRAASWVAVAKRSTHPIGSYRSLLAAARALARDAGSPRPRVHVVAAEPTE